MRIFIVNDDDSLRRLPNAKYERMLNRDPKEPLMQYADKRIRYASVIFETENRRPVKIIRIEYSYLFFDSEGFIDSKEREKEIRLGMDMIPSYGDARESRRVIDAQHKFAKRRYKNQYLWTPSRELEVAIVDAVLSP